MLVKRSVSMFQCQSIDDKSYLRSDYSIQCWSPEHNSWTYGIGVPSLFLWGIGFPALMGALLVRNRSTLGKLSTKVRYGYMFKGYKQSSFYWEILIIYRKVALVALVVFTNGWERRAQVLTALGLLLGFLYLHMVEQPFNSRNLNTIDGYSQVIAVVTLYLGLFYISEDLSNTVRASIFLVMVLLNAGFVILWAEQCFGLSERLKVRLALRARSGKVESMSQLTPLPETGRLCENSHEISRSSGLQKPFGVDDSNNSKLGLL
mmetsp:Transcript_39641/g.45133  ORF Transcript_39641/g.45133 Transcript_39641/m.45133 type:complete len:262 (+) Transcript_39641:1-786(+)